jgi:hypothetical protein
MTRRMAGNKGVTKSKGKSSTPALVDDCLLQPKEIIQWQATIGGKRPYEGAEEIILF